ncbi:Zn-ribbon domain-containing OB-fold protein [Oceanobacillus halophilus]|uniref:Zn-ribbon domain-containing OB-fold protein n=1 Tax=Oceanobacillus halophilus TaxID=930130 RepID=UPI001314C79A|nr:Zn-ribbon domain-containing OB-fold protein [Oceanobacillus halophilus]
MKYHKPLPDIKGIGETYWKNLKKGKLTIQHCNDCQRMFFYPRVACPICGGTRIAFKEHNGLGEIYSYTIAHKSIVDGFKDEVPYVVALVRLDGVRGNMMTNIVDCELNDIEIGASVEIEYRDVTEDITLPIFKLVKEGN